MSCGATPRSIIQYVGSNTSHLDRSFFNNTPTPGPGDVDPRRPSQKFRSRRMIQNDLIADYDAISVILRKRMSHGIQADAHYTWSRTRDMATHSNGGGQTMDNYDIWRDYGPANWDIPHRFVASYLYDVPFLKDSSNAFLKYVVAGWQVSGITTVQSGSPVNVTISADRANIGITGLQRPDLVGPVPSLNCVPDPARPPQLMNCFDASAFALPAQFTFGNASRNLLRGPKFVNTDLSLMKNVLARRRRHLPDPGGDVQHLQHGQLGQPQCVVRQHGVRPHHLCGRDAAGAAGGEGAVLSALLVAAGWFVAFCQHLLVASGAPPPRAAWAPPRLLASLARLRRLRRQALARTSAQIVSRAVSSNRAGGAVCAWGWGPTRAGGGGVPARNQEMLTERHESSGCTI